MFKDREILAQTCSNVPQLYNKGFSLMQPVITLQSPIRSLQRVVWPRTYRDKSSNSSLSVFADKFTTEVFITDWI